MHYMQLRELNRDFSAPKKKKHYAEFKRPDNDVLVQMREDWSIAVTAIQQWKLHIDLQGGAQGHLSLPPLFHNHTFYMLSGWNPGDNKWTDPQNKEANALLKQEIAVLEPRPIAVFPCSSETVQPEYIWREEGFALQYSGVQKSKDLENVVARLARRFGQVAIVRLIPHKWGKVKSLHTSVLRTIIPTGTAMNLLVHEGPVYQFREHSDEPDT